MPIQSLLRKPRLSYTANRCAFRIRVRIPRPVGSRERIFTARNTTKATYVHSTESAARYSSKSYGDWKPTDYESRQKDDGLHQVPRTHHELEQANNELRQENDNLRKENDTLRGAVKTLKNVNETLRKAAAIIPIPPPRTVAGPSAPDLTIPVGRGTDISLIDRELDADMKRAEGVEHAVDRKLPEIYEIPYFGKGEMFDEKNGLSGCTYPTDPSNRSWICPRPHLLGDYVIRHDRLSCPGCRLSRDQALEENHEIKLVDWDIPPGISSWTIIPKRGNYMWTWDWIRQRKLNKFPAYRHCGHERLVKSLAKIMDLQGYSLKEIVNYIKQPFKFVNAQDARQLHVKLHEERKKQDQDKKSEEEANGEVLEGDKHKEEAPVYFQRSSPPKIYEIPYLGEDEELNIHKGPRNCTYPADPLERSWICPKFHPVGTYVMRHDRKGCPGCHYPRENGKLDTWKPPQRVDWDLPAGLGNWTIIPDLGGTDGEWVTPKRTKRPKAKKGYRTKTFNQRAILLADIMGMQGYTRQAIADKLKKPFRFADDEIAIQMRDQLMAQTGKSEQMKTRRRRRL